MPLTRDGQVEVLDFGLAKLLPTPEPGSESALGPELDRPRDRDEIEGAERR